MPRHQFRRALATCLMIASALLALLPESVAAEQRAVRFRMDWIPSGMYAPFFYGYDAGVFAKNGIDLDIVNGNGSLTTIADVDAGNVKFGMSGCAGAALAISKGRKIISIASYMAKYSWAFYVPEDSAFKNIGDLKKILKGDLRRDFYSCLTEKLLTYSLGRGLDYHDVETVDQIVARMERNDGRFSALLMGIIESSPFQKRRVAPAAMASSHAPNATNIGAHP